MQITKDSDSVVYMASRYIYAESKKRDLTGLEWQVTWLAVAKWISENWDIDRCLSYLADRIYYGHGYYGLKEASTGDHEVYAGTSIRQARRVWLIDIGNSKRYKKYPLSG